MAPSLSRRRDALVIGLLVLGVALVALGSAWLPAVLAGIAAILVAGLVAMR